MTAVDPTTELDVRYSAPSAVPTSWAQAVEVLTNAEVFWLSTTRPTGQPHVTPLIAVWQDDALNFRTGPGERKARNLAENPLFVVPPATAFGFARGEYSQTRWRFASR